MSGKVKAKINKNRTRRFICLQKRYISEEFFPISVPLPVQPQPESHCLPSPQSPPAALHGPRPHSAGPEHVPHPSNGNGINTILKYCYQ